MTHFGDRHRQECSINSIDIYKPIVCYNLSVLPAYTADTVSAQPELGKEETMNVSCPVVLFTVHTSKLTYRQRTFITLISAAPAKEFDGSTQ